MSQKLIDLFNSINLPEGMEGILTIYHKDNKKQHVMPGGIESFMSATFVFEERTVDYFFSLHFVKAGSIEYFALSKSSFSPEVGFIGMISFSLEPESFKDEVEKIFQKAVEEEMSKVAKDDTDEILEEIFKDDE